MYLKKIVQFCVDIPLFVLSIYNGPKILDSKKGYVKVGL